MSESDFDVVVLAVKPAMAREAIGSLPGTVLSRAVLVSVMAGVGCSEMSDAAGNCAPVVRAMPNTAVMVNQGCTGLFSTTLVDPAKRGQIQKLFEAVGIAVWLEREAQVDAVTAISGSGPAYYHLFSEALANAGVELGLPIELARQLAAQTALGAATLQCQPQADFAALREAVTSPNGTTAAAIAKFEENDQLRRLVMLAAQAAHARNMAIQMLVALVAGSAVGALLPQFASDLSPLSAAFMKLIKALGIANIGKGANVGRLGLRAIIYFEVLTTLAMAMGLLVSRLFEPGAGMNIDYHTLNTNAISSFVATAEHRTTVSWLLSIIPDTFLSAFINGNLLPILLMAVMFGMALLKMGARASSLVDMMEKMSEAVFGMVGMVMKFAPLAVFGAIGYTIGNYGLASMVPLLKFLVLFYACCVVFIALVLGSVCLYTRVSLCRLIMYLRVEILLAFGTASSEAVLPNIMKKLVEGGVKKHVVGFVIPAGFSFNLDGSSMYFVMAIMFVAQACNVPLTLSQELSMILVFMLTSKGIAGVAGAGFVTLAATLQMFPKFRSPASYCCWVSIVSWTPCVP
ncbi:unnamed protein product, partial [Mesorhabditis spiculigera]